MTLDRYLRLPASLFIVALCVAPTMCSADSDATFGDYIVHYNAISTNQLLPAVAKQYGIERSAKRGLLNISVESKTGNPHTVSAEITATVGDLTGHDKPISIRETSENGDIDYLGEFPIDASGTFVFKVKVATPGQQQPFVVKFSQDLVAE
jgi:hypothetical protein